MAIASGLPPPPLPLLLLFVAFLHSGEARSHSANISAIEAAVRDRAFELLRRTNQPVDVPGGGAVEATALRVRSSALWADGVNGTGTGTGAAAAGFTVPPRVAAVPFARRVAVVFERFLGDASGELFAAPRGYALAAPVVALLAYDASAAAAAAGPNGRLSLRAFGAPVLVEFKNVSSFNATTARCLTFAASGKAVATHAVVSGSACAVSGTGHYGMAVRVETLPPPPPTVVRGRWWVWTVGVGAGGVLGVSFLAVSVVGAVRWGRRRRREKMERRAMAGEELGRMVVQGSRMPSAKMVRTLPEVEDGSPSPWRKS